MTVKFEQLNTRVLVAKPLVKSVTKCEKFKLGRMKRPDVKRGWAAVNILDAFN